MKRCTSPSHFLVDEAEEIKHGPEYLLDIAGRERVDLLLRSVSSAYMKPRDVHPSGSSVWINSEYDDTEYTSLDMLMSPLRKPSPLDTWSPKEIACFELGICELGKDFAAIARRMPQGPSGQARKTTAHLVDFYYNAWKHSSHYYAWKAARDKEMDRLAMAGMTHANPDDAAGAGAEAGAGEGGERTADGQADDGPSLKKRRLETATALPHSAT